jgi:mannose-6-phosphate isomerase-like protein (cupin superfamily)
MADVDTEPVVVRYADLERRTWGDEESGRLPDWFYADNPNLNLNIVGMAPNGAVLHSDKNRSIFGSDELFYVLEGMMVQSNPATGEVYVIKPGEATFFRKDTWHHQFNYSNSQLRMLEFFQPAPKTGTGSKYAQSKQNLTPPFNHKRDEFLGRWPMDAEEAAKEQTMWVIRDDNILWRLEGNVRGREILVGILASTEHMTVGKIEFLGGQRSSEFVHNGDKVVFLEKGNLHIEFPDNKRWVELGAFDGCRIPQGTRHSYYNMSADPAKCVFSVAPDYLPGLVD